MLFIACLLLTCGYSYAQQDIFGAAEEGNVGLVKKLLKKGDSPNAVSENGFPVLKLAVKQGNKGVVKALVEAGADINAKDTEGNTSLMGLVTKSEVDASLLKLFLSKKPDLNLQNKKGETALYLATAYTQNPATIKALIQAGADKTIKANDGQTAIERAKRYPKIAKLFQ